MADNKIEIANLTKAFAARGRRVLAVDDVTVNVPRGQFVCLVGPSGCGKTTLLRIVAGLEQLSYGNLQVARDDPSSPINAMIFQEQSLFPWMTVRDNVSYGLRMRGVPKQTYRPSSTAISPKSDCRTSPTSIRISCRAA